MASVNLSPSLIAKLRIRDAVDRMKHKSPKLQEVFRQRCCERMKERRAQMFNRRRLGLELGSKEVEHTLTDVLCQEIDNFGKSSNIVDDWLDEEAAESTEAEPSTDEMQWIFEEYERMLQYEMELLESLFYEDAKKVVCPVCQKCILTEDSNSVICKACGLSVTSNLETIGNSIDECVNKHSVNCYAVPGFTMVNEDGKSSLYMTCEDCSSLAFVL